MLLLLAASSLTLVLPQPIYAQKNNEIEAPTWYEIEILIFSRNQPDPEHSEYWNRYLKLEYPSKLLALDTKLKRSEINYIQAAKKPETTPGSLSSEQINPESLQNEKPDLIPDYPPYANLGTKRSSLNQAKSRISKSGQYQNLYHARWVQPLVNKQNTLPILIQAGKRYGHQYELEGTISVSVSRYLHIDTNLWLSSFTENQILMETWWLNDANEKSSTPLIVNYQETEAKQCNQHFNTHVDINGDSNKTAIQSDGKTDYIVSQIAQLKQSRRMRSNEIHYLDHPLYGIIITAKPYKLPQASIPENSSFSTNEATSN